MPSTLSTITNVFPPDERGKAVGVWVGLAGGGAVLGLFASGLLLEWFSWSSFFVLNVGLAVLAVIGTLAFVPNTRDPAPPRFDVLGALLSLLGVAGLIFGIIEGPTLGWSDPFVLVGLVGGALALIGFVLWELHIDAPMLDPRLFRLRGFGTGSATITVQFLAFFGFIFIVMQYLQFVVGLSALEAAFAMLPFPVVMIPLSRQAPGIATRVGGNIIGAIGLVLMAVAMVVFSFLEVDLTYAVLAGGLVLLAGGLALSSTPATTAIVDSLPAAKQGVASAVNDTSREFGTALGIAVMGSVLNAQYKSRLEPALTGAPEELAEGAEDSIAFAQGVADQLGSAGDKLADAASKSFVDAMGVSTLVAAGILVAGAAFVAFRAPRRGDRLHSA